MATTLKTWTARQGVPRASNAPGFSYTDGTNFAYHHADFAVNELLNFHSVVPASYTANGDINIVVLWVPPVGTSGSATWGAKVLGREDGEAFDAALSSQSTQADAVQSTGDIHHATIAISAPALSPGDAFVIELELTSALTGGDAYLISLELQEQ
jgi:hypothetical protein